MALGLAGLGSGGIAVFVTHLEAGPVALLAVGLVLLLVGAGGRLPSRLKVGDNEAAWEVAIEGFVSRVADGVSDEQAPQLVEALNDLAGVAPAAAAVGLWAVSSRMAYERHVTKMVIRAGHEINQSILAERKPGLKQLTYSVERGETDEARFDATIVGPNRTVLVIAAKYFSDVMPAVLVAQALEQLRRRAARLRQEVGQAKTIKVLIISNQRLSGAASRVVGTWRDFQFLIIEGDEDLPKLVEAIRTAFSLDDLQDSR